MMSTEDKGTKDNCGRKTVKNIQNDVYRRLYALAEFLKGGVITYKMMSTEDTWGSKNELDTVVKTYKMMST